MPSSEARQPGLNPETVAAHILKLANNPDAYLPPIEPSDEKAQVEPDEECPLDENQQLVLYPENGSLMSDLKKLAGKTVWAIDGGAMTIDLPFGMLIVGRAVVVRIEFYGYESAKRDLIVPALPFVVCGGSVASEVPDAVSLYLKEAIKLVPTDPAKQKGSSLVEYFSDGDDYLSRFADAWSGVSDNEQVTKQAIDLARNAAETIAFQAALRVAKRNHLVLRDGRLHGSAGFWTTLCKLDGKEPLQEAVDALDSFIQDVRSAIGAGVRVAGIIKRPVSEECVRWLRANGYGEARYSTDALLYMNACSRTTGGKPTYGKWSTRWRYKPYTSQPMKEHQSDEEPTPRQKLEQFRRDVSFCYLMPGLFAPAFRIDVPRYDNVYSGWFDDVVQDIYTLARGSGTPSRVPHPIKFADRYARVSHAEVYRFLQGTIQALENTSEGKSIASEIRAWLKRGR